MQNGSKNMFVVVAGMGHIQHMSALGCAAVSRRVRSLGLFWVKLRWKQVVLNTESMGWDEIRKSYRLVAQELRH